MPTTEEPTHTTTSDEGFEFDITDPKILVGVICGITFVLATITVAVCCSCGGRQKKKKRRRPPQPMTQTQAFVVPMQGGQQQHIIVVNNNPQGHPKANQANHPRGRPSPRTGPPGTGPRPGARPGPRGPTAPPSGQTTARVQVPYINTQPAGNNRNHRPMTISSLEQRPQTEENRYIRFQVPPPDTGRKPSHVANVDAKLTEISEFFTRAFKRVLESISIPPGQIEKKDILGSGQFGIVFRGEMTSDNGKKSLVALKTVAGDADDEGDIQEFMEEVLRMKHFSHPNVMSLLGMTIMDQKPYIVMPFMKNGDLKTYISEPTRILTVEELVRSALQVSRGMEYLAAQNIIHGDLAARNCMVGEDDMVKVSDFGLSRHLFQSDYYSLSDSETLRPYRWMAVECTSESKFTIKSDVWSFGVLLWEIMTRGQRPYPDYKTNTEVGEQLIKGYRMPCPEYCAIEIHEVMMKCWDNDPANRPNFKDVTSTLDQLLKEAGGDYEKPIDTSKL